MDVERHPFFIGKTPQTGGDLQGFHSYESIYRERFLYTKFYIFNLKL